MAHTPLPDVIANAPQLLPGMAFYYTAFLALGSCRYSGMSEGRIPWIAAHDYAERLGLDADEFEDLWMLVNALDACYLKHMSDKRTKDAKKPKSK